MKMKDVLGMLMMYPPTAPCFVIGLTWGLSVIVSRFYRKSNLIITGICFLLALLIWASAIYVVKH